MNVRKILFAGSIVLAVILVLAVAGAPQAMKALGLHPEFKGQRYLVADGRALIIATSHDQLGDDGEPTGVFASELTAPYYEFADGRMRVDVASIKGGPVPIDPMSFRRALRSEYDLRYLQDAEARKKVENSLRIDDVDFRQYDVIFLAGGWGAAYDLGYSETLGQKISEAYAAGKVIGGVCHGLLGLLKARGAGGRPLVEGVRLTAVTDKQVRELGISVTPQHPERELRAAGARFESATAFRDIFANHVAVDGRIVSGQNQNASPEVANLMMKLAGGTRR